MKKSMFYSVLCLLSIVLLPACCCRKGCVSIMDRCNQVEECRDQSCDSCNIDATDVSVECDDTCRQSVKEPAEVTAINQL